MKWCASIWPRWKIENAEKAPSPAIESKHFSHKHATSKTISSNKVLSYAFRLTCLFSRVRLYGPTIELHNSIIHIAEHFFCISSDSPPHSGSNFFLRLMTWTVVYSLWNSESEFMIAIDSHYKRECVATHHSISIKWSAWIWCNLAAIS